MTVEVATYIADLDETNPADSALANELDDHLRLIKAVLKNTFNGTPVTDVFDEAVTPTMAEMNTWDARLTALEAFVSPAEQAPVFRHQVVTAGAGNIVVSLGFRPSIIIGWAITTGVPAIFQMSFGAWNETDDKGFPLSFSGDGWSTGAWDRTLVYLSSLYTLVNQTSITEQISIANVNNDGFEIARDVVTTGADLLYIAWPNADQ